MNSATVTTGYNAHSSWTAYYPTITNVAPSVHPITGGATADYESPSGVKGNITILKGVKGIHPQLYFSYVKSKLSKIEKEKLAKRVQKLRSMVVAADDMNQQALYENLATMLAIAVRESEAFVCGFDKYVQKKDITKFINSVKERTVKFEDLEKFPRIIPADARNKIKSCQEKNIFDKYQIVYVDYTKEELKTSKEKIRAKDPIVFGSFSFQEEILYFIADWVDEYCDITLDKMVESLKRDDPEYSLKKVPELSDRALKSLVQEVKARHERLKGTSPSNYHGQMRQEDVDNASRKQRPNFLQRIIQKFSSM